MKTRIFHLHSLSAVHVGTGQGVGAVDLPIARSRATNLPIVPGSSLKGVLRDEAKDKWHLDNNDICALFGSESTADSSHASAAVFGDAQLLILPIRSFAGTIAYATCPFILQRYRRDLGLSINVPNSNETAQTVPESLLLLADKQSIALEDLDMKAECTDSASQWAQTIAQFLYPEGTENQNAWREQFIKRFIILPDSEFSFLSDTATEIRMRIKIDRQTRIVQTGALWSEENLPAETILWGIMGIDSSRYAKVKKDAEALSALIPQGETSIQIGGKHTVGRGLCRLLLD